jgi:hypothetical protein
MSIRDKAQGMVFELTKLFEDLENSKSNLIQALIDSCEVVKKSIDENDENEEIKTLGHYIWSIRFTLRRIQEIQTTGENRCFNCKYRKKLSGYPIGAYFCTVLEKDIDWHFTCQDHDHM